MFRSPHPSGRLRLFGVAVTAAFAAAAPGAALAGPSVRVMQSVGEGIPGPASAGREGDFLLENGALRVVVSAVEHPLGIAMSGGRIIDAAPPGGEDSWGQATLMLTDEEPRQARYLEWQLVEPGERGDRVGVRFLGVDSRVPDIEIETEYLVGEGEPFVTIRTTYRWPFYGDQNEGWAADRIDVGRTVPFLPHAGFLAEGEPSGADSTVPFDLMMFAGDGVTYGWQSPREAGVGPFEEGAIRFRWSRFSVPGKSERAFTRRFYVVAGDPAALLSRVADPPLAPARGSVEGARRRAPAAGATVEFHDPTGILAVATTGADGRFEAYLPAGEYTVRPVSAAGEEGRSHRYRATPGETEEMELAVPDPAAVRFTIEEEGAPGPGRVTILDRRGDRREREAGRRAPLETIVSAGGGGTFDLPAGAYTLIASRGIEYSIDRREVDVDAGDTVDVLFRLRREVDRPGLVAADLGLRTVASLTAPATAGERFDAARAEGLDVVVLADLGRVTEHLAPEGLTVISGEELRIGDLGRFNVFPIARENEIPNRGGYGAEGQSPARVFDIVRRRPGPPFIQVLTPRAERDGYFQATAVDPVTGLSTNIEFDASFDLLEIAEGRDLAKAGAVLADWFHLLGQGKRIVATGNSEAGRGGPAPVGMPRTYIETGGGRDEAETLRALREGRAFLTTGPFLRFRVNGSARPGDLVTDRDGLVEVDVRVDAASWIGVDRVRVFGNGVPLYEESLGGRSLPAEARETVAIYTDTWFVAVVSGRRALGAPFTGPDGEPVLPVAVSNPVWVDFNGDGRFDAPGVQ